MSPKITYLSINFILYHKLNNTSKLLRNLIHYIMYSPIYYFNDNTFLIKMNKYNIVCCNSNSYIHLIIFLNKEFMIYFYFVCFPATTIRRTNIIIPLKNPNLPIYTILSFQGFHFRLPHSTLSHQRQLLVK